MLEKQIEKAVCEYAREKGMLAYKFTSPAHFAVPDRIFFYKGTTFLIEFKAPGKRPTGPQLREHDRFYSHGICVYVVDDIGVGIEIISSYL